MKFIKRYLKERRKRLRTCDICNLEKEDTTLRLDPYHLEVNNKKRWVRRCDICTTEEAQFI